jgi:hypothetical protein
MGDIVNLGAMRSKLFMPVVIVNCVVLALVMKLGFIFVLLAMLPTVAAYYIEQNNGKPAFKVIAACNLAAAMHTLLPMLSKAIQFEKIELLPIMTSPRIWLVIYGGAALGWCLIFICRYLARFIVIMYFDHQTTTLERFQKKLLEEWGAQIENS